MALTAEQIKAQDLVAGSQGECYITIEGNRYNFASIKELNIEFEKTKTEVKALGRTGTINKTTGWKGAGDGTMYYNQSVLRMLLYRYAQTGEDAYFDIQVSNEDATSRRGRQTVIAKECNTDGGVLARLNADDEVLEEDISFTYDEFEIPEKFLTPNDML
jgi:hypothetical protein